MFEQQVSNLVLCLLLSAVVENEVIEIPTIKVIHDCISMVNNCNGILENIFTRSMLKIFGLDSLITDIRRSIIEIITREPSIIFHPEVKYASGP